MHGNVFQTRLQVFRFNITRHQLINSGSMGHVRFCWCVPGLCLGHCLDCNSRRAKIWGLSFSATKMLVCGCAANIFISPGSASVPPSARHMYSGTWNITYVYSAFKCLFTTKHTWRVKGNLTPHCMQHMPTTLRWNYYITSATYKHFCRFAPLDTDHHQVDSAVQWLLLFLLSSLSPFALRVYRFWSADVLVFFEQALPCETTSLWLIPPCLTTPWPRLRWQAG